MKTVVSIIKNERLAMPLAWVAILAAILLAGKGGEQATALVKYSTAIKETTIGGKGLTGYIDGYTNPLSSTNQIIKNEAEFKRITAAKPSIFNIKTQRDTVVTGSKGVKVFIPANSFENVNTYDEVKIELKEYTCKADLLFSGLATTSNGSLLESGGSIYIAAMCNGKSVALKKGREITVAFPNAKPEPEMQTFYGETLANGSFNWQPAQGNTNYNNRPRYKMASFIETQAKPKTVALVNKKFYIRSIGTNKDATRFKDPGTDSTVIQYLDKTFKVTDEEYELLKGSYFLMRFTADKAGNVTRPYIMHEMHKVNTYGNAWRRQKARDAIRLRLRHTLTGLPCVEKTPFNKNEYIVFYIDKFECAKEGNEVFNIEAAGPADEKVVKKWVLDTAVDALSDNDYNVLASARLGYINCDHYFKSPRTANQVVAFDNSVPYKRKVDLVLDDAMSVMPGFEDEAGNWRFESLPENEWVSYVVLEYRPDAIYYAVQKVQASTNTITYTAQFKPLVIEHLQRDLGQEVL